MMVSMVIITMLLATPSATSDTGTNPSIAANQLAVGGVSLGDSEERVRRVLGTPAEVKDEPDDLDGPSRTLEYLGLVVLLSGGKVCNVQASSSRYKTPKGARVGDSVERVMKLYGRLPLEAAAGMLEYNVTGTDTYLRLHYSGGRIVEIELWFDFT
jgi:hypothetical protein